MEAEMAEPTLPTAFTTLCPMPVTALIAPAVAIPFNAPPRPKPPPTTRPRLSLRNSRYTQTPICVFMSATPEPLKCFLTMVSWKNMFSVESFFKNISELSEKKSKLKREIEYIKRISIGDIERISGI